MKCKYIHRGKIHEDPRRWLKRLCDTGKVSICSGVAKGPGDCLRDRIHTLTRITEKPSCKCRCRIRNMNRWGVAGCLEHIAEIVGWMIEGARKRRLWKWTTMMPGARLAVKRLLVLPAIRKAQKEAMKNVPNTFDRVVLINMKRQPDRLRATLDQLTPDRWPFKMPEVFEAVDCFTMSPPPLHWEHGRMERAWLADHAMLLRDMDAVHIFVMLDEIVLADDFSEKAAQFIIACPDDADGFAFGCHHIEEPIRVRDGVLQCQGVEDVFAYSLKRKGVVAFLQILNTMQVPFDEAFSELAKKLKIYAPEHELCTLRPPEKCPLACQCRKKDTPTGVAPLEAV